MSNSLVTNHTTPAPLASRRPAAAALRSARRHGMTLIEILIIVVILGILAAIVVPELSSASRQAREGVMKDDCRFMREQILRYRIQHDDVPPGYPGGSMSAVPTEADLIAQMTRYTDFRGNTAAAYTDIFRYGPYLTRIPDNPLTGLSGIHVVANGGVIPPPDKTQPYGWIYKPETMEFIPNMPGLDLDQKPYTSY